MRRAVLVAAVALAGCGSFEDPSIVIDLRTLGMAAQPPEQVSPVDLQNPTNLTFGDVTVCALVADPGAERRLAWSMVACPPTGDRRCDDPDGPVAAMGSGVIEDPDTAATPQPMCATLPFGGATLAVLQATIENDSLSGFGGVDVNVGLRVVPEGGGEDQAIYGGKSVRYSPQLPAERVANTNPTLERIDMDQGDPAAAVPLPLGRCVDQDPATMLTLPPGGSVHLMPVEPPGVREDYVVPTFEGGSRMFTENLTYQWLAGAGDWTRTGTGGPRDGAGNQPDLDTEWQAPAAEDVAAGGMLVPLWVIQRDERGGGRWFESCVRVQP